MIRRLVSVAALVSICLISCTKSQPSGAESSSDSKAGKDGGLKVGLVLDKGGKDDKSFNSAAFRGATQAVKELGVELKEVECPDDAAFEPALRTFAERGYPLVIAVGFAQIDAVKKVAPQFLNTNFAIVDAIVDGPNVASLMFAEHEGSYLVGMLAALMSKSGKIGFVGGMDIPLIRRFEMGYDAGVLMLAGPAANRLPANLPGIKEITERFADPRLVAEISTDDWPFFYMPRRTYPLTYALMIAVLLVL
ncbi:MAG: BMP family ABC transporter substrate-binding protein, partial [Bdellovibrionota bacterium]